VGVLNIHDIMLARNVHAYRATRNRHVLKVTAQVAAPGAESAVCDCRVLLIQQVRRNDSWLWDYLIGYLVLEFLYWLRSAFRYNYVFYVFFRFQKNVF